MMILKNQCQRPSWWLLVLCSFIVTPAQAGRYDDLKNQVDRLEQQVVRMTALQSDNTVLLDMSKRLDRIQQEMQSMRGEVEQLNYEVQGIKKRQRDLYLDIDRRINNLQPDDSLSSSVPVPNTASGGTNAASLAVGTPASDRSADRGPASNDTGDNDITVPLSQIRRQEAGQPNVATVAANLSTSLSTTASATAERPAYEKAFSALRDGQHQQAITGFQSFLKAYPNGQYADNAQYWLGEAYYVSGNYEKAATAFQTLAKQYPASPKLPDAKLKLGYTFYEMQDWQQAKQLFQDVQTNYPQTSVASLAGKRLVRMTEEGR